MKMVNSTRNCLIDELDYSLYNNIDWNKDDLLLDIGSNNGFYDNILLKKLNKIYGIDVNADLLKNRVNKDIDVFLADAHDIPFKDESFTKVLCYRVFYYLDPEVAAKEMARVCKPDGRIIVTTSNIIYLNQIIFLILKYLYRNILGRKTVKTNFYYPDKMIRLFERLGMSLEYCCSVNYYWPLIPNILDYQIIPNVIMKNVIKYYRKLLNKPQKYHKPDILAGDYILVLKNDKM